MRILQIRFMNLNSLVGEWQIDLTHPAFASDGIFAITGPTGAGKTTILDAICLALYGRTPRLNKVTKSGNEIMSRQSGECFAEVIFETQAGRYRCHWSQHRARRKPGGELQAPKHEIANADSGEIFETKIRGVADQIESATGMNFDRFTRSMLLAQGGFAAFLQAAPDERAPILEQITGTEIYSQISIRVHERKQQERTKLDLLQAETAGITILEPEREKEIGQTLETRQREEADLSVKSTDMREAIAWLTTIDSLEKEIISLADETSKLQNDIEAFKPDHEKLRLALSAASLDGAYAMLTATRKQQAEDKAALWEWQEALPGLESSAREQARTLKAAERQTARVKQELKTAAPILRNIRSLDQKLAGQQKAVAESEEDCSKHAAKIDAARQTRLKEQEKCVRTQETLKLVDGYFKEHAQDKWLISGLAGVEEQLNALLLRQNEIRQKESARAKAAKALQQATISLDECQRQSSARQRALEDASNQLQQGKAVLSQLLGERLLREYRTEKDTLLEKMALLSKIAELEDHRAKLADGEPCPLCGATEHPFAQGNVPVPDESKQRIDALTRLIDKAEAQETAIDKLEAAESLARSNLTEAEKQQLAAIHDKKAAEKNLAEVTESLEKHRADFAEGRQVVAAKLRPLGITDLPETNMSSLLETLRARLKAWQAQVEKKAAIEKQLADLNSDVKHLDGVIETQSATLAEKQDRLASLQKEFAAGNDERKARYGDKNPDDEESRLHKAVTDAEQAERQARERHNERQQTWNTTKGHIESLEKQIDRREPELRRSETEFSSALAPLGFANEERFQQAILPSAWRDKLMAEARTLDERQTALQARRSDRETRLATQRQQKVTDKSLEELEPQHKAYEEALKESRDVIVRLQQQLSDNTAAKARVKEKQTAIDAQNKECRRWENLHELIGSADGKKYRNFAQGLTFDMMIGHANQQLQKMTDRYLLIRDDVQPLRLNVVDNYQAGEIRSTENLSGGESFIVSLSLALGLSHMASKNVRVDSLFLDEGFGTLDEEALETALETLAGLQQDGKLIGVISHVQALKERIGAQIQITPQTGGRSQISGPGCRWLSAATERGTETV